MVIYSLCFSYSLQDTILCSSQGYGKLNLSESLMNTHYILHDGPFRSVSRGNKTWKYRCLSILSASYHIVFPSLPGAPKLFEEFQRAFH